MVGYFCGPRYVRDILAQDDAKTIENVNEARNERWSEDVNDRIVTNWIEGHTFIHIAITKGKADVN